MTVVISPEMAICLWTLAGFLSLKLVAWADDEESLVAYGVRRPELSAACLLGGPASFFFAAVYALARAADDFPPW